MINVDHLAIVVLVNVLIILLKYLRIDTISNLILCFGNTPGDMFGETFHNMKWCDVRVANRVEL